MSLGDTATKSVLVVEDNDVEREGLAFVLRSHGFQVAAVANGEEALAHLRGQKPDLIVLSLFLSVCNGWEFLRDHKGEWWPTPVLILLPSTIAPTTELAASFGAKDALGKPINTAELLRKVAQYCG